jgi:hypothetical protein
VPGPAKPPLLPAPPAAVARRPASTARSLARDAFGREIAPPEEEPVDPMAPAEDGPSPRRETATDAIGRRAGALSDELDFTEFVASLVHGTFDAIVDSSIRQMESFADLVAAVAKPVDQFTQENVSLNQARDFLVEQYPQDLALTRDETGVRVVPRRLVGEDGDEEMRSPEWLDEYGMGGEELTSEVIEETLVPKARERVARNRLQTLSTMVLLGMNRVVVRDGTIGARLRFRAAAADHTAVDYAVSDDAGEAPATEWGRRGSRSYAAPRTKVSTVGVNVQSDSELKAELFGDVKINFASETVPLDRFIDEARRNVLERHARPTARSEAARPATPETSAITPAITPAPAVPSLPAAPPPTPPASTPPVPPAGGAR